MCDQEWDTTGRRGWDARCEACVLAADESCHRNRVDRNRVDTVERYIYRERDRDEVEIERLYIDT